MARTKLESLSGEPIIVHTLLEGWSAADDLAPALDEMVTALDSVSDPVYYITDMSYGARVSMQDMIVAANQMTRGAGAMLHHPNLKEYLVVTQNSMFSLAARGLRSEIFGNVPVTVFDTLEEALTYARSR